MRIIKEESLLAALSNYARTLFAVSSQAPNKRSMCCRELG